MPPEDGRMSLGSSAAPSEQGSGRHDRASLIAFVGDIKSEEALREGLSDTTSETLDVRRGGIRLAIATMQKIPTPRVLVVDLTGEDQPLSALSELANVVEPDVCVLVVGDVEHADFYREVTRGMGAAEYLTKPVTRDKVLRHFGPYVQGSGFAAPTMLGGRAIAVTGARGGVGATTIAVNLAWQLGVTMRRHTVLLDPDTHMGATAFLLNVQPGPGLRMALEAPDRIDSLLAERAAQPAADRLHVLAAEEKISTPSNHAPGAAAPLLTALRNRYNFIVADVPYGPVPLYRDLLDLVDQRILIMDPSLAAIRDTVRLMGLQKGTRQDQRAVVVLNRNGMAGGLTRKQVEEALKMKVDVSIPDLPRQVGNAATLGEPVAVSSKAFRDGISEIIHQVASVRLLDSGGTGGDAVVSQGKRNIFSFLWRKS